MRTYETIYIVHPETAGDAYTALLAKLQDVLEKQDAQILHVDEWGLRKLAYPVRKQAKGSYVQVVFQAGSEVVAEYERRLRIEDTVLKYQTVLLEDGFDAAALAKDKPVAEGEAKAEAADAEAEA